jgi:PAS domain S-box-containing protein
MRHTMGNLESMESLSPFGFPSKPVANSLRGEDYFRKVLDELPAAIYTTDAKGRITYFNEAAAALWGCRPELGKSEWCGSWKLYWPDGTPLPHGECPMALALEEKRAVRGMEAVAERPDGTRVPFIPYPTPLYSRTGKLVGAVNMLVDITDRKLMETLAHRIASIVESSDDAIISKDLNGTILSWNDGAGRLFGYTAQEAIGKSVTILIPPDRLDEEPGIIKRIQNGERVDHYETVRRRKDGSLVDISLTVSPVKDASGKIVGASKIARDISDRKRAEEQKTLLLFEMKHRIKNTLATVQALATQTMRSASAEERGAFIARLQSLASAHDLLVSEQWNRALVRDVVHSALNAFQEKHRERFLIEGPDDIWLDSDKSLSVAMMLHELATNSVKYGALSNFSGRVSVAWESLPHATPARVKLHWKERGGPPVKPPERRGFGSRLLSHALGGEPPRMDFDPRGLDCVLDVVL